MKPRETIILVTVMTLGLTSPALSFKHDLFFNTGLKHHAQVSFQVYGGYDKTCKKSIERAVLKLNGIDAVEWSAKKQMLTAVYDPMILDPLDIRKAIAAIGYDTDLIKASNEAYSLLKDCCKYERSKN